MNFCKFPYFIVVLEEYGFVKFLSQNFEMWHHLYFLKFVGLLLILMCIYTYTHFWGGRGRQKALSDCAVIFKKGC